MNLLVLDATTSTIQAVLAGAVAATQPDFTAHYADVDPDDATDKFVEGYGGGTLNSTTPVTLVAAPAASERRVVRDISIYNADSAPVVVTVSYNENATLRVIQKFTLATGGSWKLSDTSTPAQAGNSGWIQVTDTWAYASATTITVPAGAASIYSKGDKFRLTANTVVLQGYIVGVADELLTVIGDALTDHTFTLPAYSKATTPVGFQHWWNYASTGISDTNSTINARFTLNGRLCTVEILITFSDTITFTTHPTLPITASSTARFSSQLYSPSGVAGYYGSNGVIHTIYPSVLANGTVVWLYVAANGTSISATAPITWNSGHAITAHFSYEI